MKNLRIIAELSKTAKPEHKIAIYYDFMTDEVLTAEMIKNHPPEQILLCTELINPNDEREIEIAIIRALLM